MKQLPDKPSELLRVALHDLEEVEKDPRYKVDMAFWHQPKEDVCRVCLAGAVLARSLGANPKKHYSVVSPKLGDVERQLEALDDFRVGRIILGLSKLDSRWRWWSGARHIRVEPYEHDPEKFKCDMRRIVVELESRGM